mgnify:CR=1
MRELKRKLNLYTHSRECSRTPPGVRELKRLGWSWAGRLSRRTPPGVRELKLIAFI